jgi:integrase
MATIESRITPEGKPSFRAKIRLRGFLAQTATFGRLTDAKRWSQATEAAIREGRYFKTLEARRHTLGEGIDRHIREVLPSRPKNSRNTKTILLWWKKQLGALTLADVTSAAIVEQRTALLTTETKRKTLRASATVVRYLAALSHLFSIAMRDWEWVLDSPLRRVSKPTVTNARRRFLSDDERQALLDACQKSKSPHLYKVVVLAISTGMRRGEILTLRWPQVELARNRLTLLHTKNGDRRAIPLAGLARELIAEHSRVRRLDTDLVFPGKVKISQWT